jgi:hypothetical protein
MPESPYWPQRGDLQTLGQAMAQRLQEFDTSGRFPVGPRIDISNMRRSENVEDLRPRSISAYLTNLLMGGAPMENLAAIWRDPFTDPRDIRNRQFQEYYNQPRPAENSDLARQLGAGDLPAFLEPFGRGVQQYGRAFTKP